MDWIWSPTITDAGSKKTLVGTPDAIKAMLAVLLTAKASDKTVSIFGGSYGDEPGWAAVVL